MSLIVIIVVSESKWERKEEIIGVGMPVHALVSDWYLRGNWLITPGPVCRINHPFFNCPCVMVGQPCTDQCDCGDWCHHPSGSSKVQGVNTADEVPTAHEKRCK